MFGTLTESRARASTSGGAGGVHVLMRSPGALGGSTESWDSISSNEISSAVLDESSYASLLSRGSSLRASVFLPIAFPTCRGEFLLVYLFLVGSLRVVCKSHLVLPKSWRLRLRG